MTPSRPDYTKAISAISRIPPSRLPSLHSVTLRVPRSGEVRLQYADNARNTGAESFRMRIAQTQTERKRHR